MAQHLLESLDCPFDLQTVALDDGPLRSSFERWGKTTVLSQFRLLPPALERRFIGARGLILRGRGCTQWQLARWRPDMVLFNSCASLPLARYLSLPRANRVLYVHETGRSLHHLRAANRAVFDAGFAAYLAVSHHVNRALQSEDVAPAKIHFTPNFLPATLLEKLENLRQNRATKIAPPWVIGGAGTLSWTKGPELWLLMAAQLSKIVGHHKVRFEWIGGRDTPADDEFAWMASQLGLQSNFALIPATSDPFAHYAHFDAFAFTSWEDAFGLVALENMALGNVVACFAQGGAPEIVGEAGIIVEGFDPIAMAARIADVLGDRAQLAHRRARNAQHVAQLNAQNNARSSTIFNSLISAPN